MASTVELVEELLKLIKPESPPDNHDILPFQNKDNSFDYDKLLMKLIDLLKHDFVSRKRMAIQLQSKDLTIKELQIENSNLAKSVRDYGKMKYQLQKQINRNAKLQTEVDRYAGEFTDLESELKSIKSILATKKL